MRGNTSKSPANILLCSGDEAIPNSWGSARTIPCLDRASRGVCCDPIRVECLHIVCFSPTSATRDWPATWPTPPLPVHFHLSTITVVIISLLVLDPLYDTELPLIACYVLKKQFQSASWGCVTKEPCWCGCGARWNTATERWMLTKPEIRYSGARTPST